MCLDLILSKKGGNNLSSRTAAGHCNRQWVGVGGKLDTEQCRTVEQQNSRTVEQQYRTIFAATRTMRRKAESCRSENARRGHHVLGSPGFLHERQQLVLVFSQKTGSRVGYNLTLHSRVSDALSHLSLWTAAAIRGLLSLPWSLKNAVTVGWWQDGGQAY